MFLQVSLTQFDCARSFIRLSPGMSLNFNFAIDFKNKIATEQKFPCVSTANGTITGLTYIIKFIRFNIYKVHPYDGLVHKCQPAKILRGSGFGS